ncbi:MAG: DUF4129 domain-containing protein [Pseudoclavibacter sp.]|nr:DUF4129 domain-containing protein [Pseudoclavibacter sp.]
MIPAPRTAQPTPTPLDPDAEEARELLARELAKPEYAQARPNPIDEAINRFWERVGDLLEGADGLAGPLPPLLIVLLALLLVAAVVFVFGRPALARRSALPDESPVLFEDDERSAQELRAAAERAAAAGRLETAIAERFRAIARELSDRTVIALRPGSTSHDVARRAEIPFPAERDALRRAADDFDGVRYLDREGRLDAYTRMSELDARLAAARPAVLQNVAELQA